MRQNIALGRLNAGEVSPRLESREDLAFYPASMRRQENMISIVQGPVTRRPGTRFVAEVKNSAAKVLLTRFVVSNEQPYELEQGDGYLRFFRDKTRMEVPETDAAIINGDFTAGIADWDNRSTGGGSRAHDATNGRLSLVTGGTAATDIGWAEQDVAIGAAYRDRLHVLVFRVHGLRGDQIELRLGTTSTGDQLISDQLCGKGWHAVSFVPNAATVYVQFRNKATTNHIYTPHNKTLQIDDVALLSAVPLEIGAPWLQADLSYPADHRFNPDRRRIKTAQDKDLLYLFHPKYQEHFLARSADYSWSLIETLHRDGPYLEENTTATQLTPGAATGAGVSVVASSKLGINKNKGFLPTDVGRLIRYKNGANAWGWMVIASVADPLNITVDINGTLTASAASATWRLGLWSDTDGHAASGGFWGERLYRGGGSNVRPQRLDGSKTGDYDYFVPGTADNDPVSYNIGSDDVANILWVMGMRDLLLGTPSGPFAVFTGTTAPNLTPVNGNARRQRKRGCADLMPVAADDVLLILEAAGRRLREVVYTIENEGYKGADLSVRADHILGGRTRQLVDMAWQAEPYGVIWGFRRDGLLVGLTYERDQETLSWHRHPLAPSAAGPAVVEAISEIPGPDGNEIWMVVRRTIDGVVRRYIEVVEPPLDDDQADQEAWYVDCGLSYSGAPTQLLTSATHLEGETVSIWTDKGVHPDRVVGENGTPGQIVLDFEVARAQVGLASSWALHPQRLTIASREGSSQGRKRRVARCAISFLRSNGVKIGREGPDQVTLIPFRTALNNMGQAVPLYSGTKEEAFAGSWDTDGAPLLFGNGPGPVTVAAIMPLADDGK